MLKVTFRFFYSPDNSDGREEEDKFRKALHRHIRFGKSRSIHFTLKGGKKVSFYCLVLIQGVRINVQNLAPHPTPDDESL